MVPEVKVAAQGRGNVLSSSSTISAMAFHPNKIIFDHLKTITNRSSGLLVASVFRIPFVVIPPILMTQISVSEFSSCLILRRNEPELLLNI